MQTATNLCFPAISSVKALTNFTSRSDLRDMAIASRHSHRASSFAATTARAVEYPPPVLFAQSLQKYMVRSGLRSVWVYLRGCFRAKSCFCLGYGLNGGASSIRGLLSW